MIQKLIEEALADYQEPEHKGTARGEPVGFSRKKMEAAALMALTSNTEREIASELTVSESVLRKWQNEENFKAVGRKFVGDFGGHFVEQIRKDVRSGLGLWDGAGSSETLSPAAEYEIYREVRSALEREGETPEWFQAALRHCVQWLLAKLQRPRKKWIYNREPHAEAMLLWRLEKMKEAKEPLEETVRLLRQRLYKEAEELLKREDLGERERKRIKSLLEDLRKSEEALQGCVAVGSEAA